MIMVHDESTGTHILSMVRIQVHDAVETAVTRGTETAVQAVRLYGTTKEGKQTTITVTDIPYEIYCDLSQTPPLVMKAKLEKYLLGTPSKCRRTCCEKCKFNEESITGSSVCNEPCIVNRRTDREAVLNVQIVEKRGYCRYEAQARPMVRVLLSRSYYAEPARRWFGFQNIHVYDMTPDAVYSLLVLKDMAGFGWYEAPSSVCTFEELRAIDSDEVVPVRHVVFDIETIAKTYKNWETALALYPVGCIVCRDDDEFIAYMLGEKVESFREPDPTKVTRIRYFDDELEMLTAFRVEQIETAQLVSGWNSDNFDMRYVFTRGRRLGGEKFGTFTDGRVLRVVHNTFADDYRVYCPGMVSVDFLPLIKRDTRIKPCDHKLNTVSHWFELGQKGDMDVSELNDAFYGTPKRRGDLLSYCALDVFLAHGIGKKAGLMTKLVANCRVKRIFPVDEMYNGGVAFASRRKLKQKLRLRNFVMFEPDTEYVLDVKTQKKQRKSKLSPFLEKVKGYVEKVHGHSFEGGYVRDPLDPQNHTAGTYPLWNVVVLDFNSLYPSIMTERNICSSTLLEYPGQLGGGDKEWVSENGFAYAQGERGILPEILVELVAERNAVKARQKLEKDPVVWEQLEAFQTGVKILANGMYGFFGMEDGGNKAVTGDTCAEGRRLAKEAGKLIEEIFSEEMGAKVIYGDTDSLMIWLKRLTSADESLACSFRIAHYINKESKLLKGVLRMGVENVCRMLLMKKKMYVMYARAVDDDKRTWESDKKTGLPKPPKLKLAGVDNRSRIPFVRARAKKMFEMVLVEGGDLTELFIETMRMLASGELSLEDIKHTTELNKQLSTYDDEAHAVAASQMEAGDILVQKGDRIEYYWCLLTGLSKDKKAKEMVVAASFVRDYDINWSAYLTEAIKALEYLAPLVKNYAKWSKPYSYEIKSGVWRDPPVQNIRLQSKKRPVQTGGLERYVNTTSKQRKALPTFTDLLNV